MRAVLQRVTYASVYINQQLKAKIDNGLLIFLGIENEDNEQDIDWLCKKIVQMRIFSDHDGKMNLSVLDLNLDVLLISQFTLFASTKKGNRPSFINAAKPEIAIPLYEKCILKLEILLNKKIKTGEFGADMKVSLENDGPVTIFIDSKNLE